MLTCLFQAGKLSTGDSFDMSPEDEKLVRAVDATLIDMEVYFPKSTASLVIFPMIWSSK